MQVVLNAQLSIHLFLLNLFLTLSFLLYTPKFDALLVHSVRSARRAAIAGCRSPLSEEASLIWKQGYHYRSHYLDSQAIEVSLKILERCQQRSAKRTRQVLSTVQTVSDMAIFQIRKATDGIKECVDKATKSVLQETIIL